MKKIAIRHLQIRVYTSVVLMVIGVLGLLSTVCAYSSLVPAGETSYQWLWCGWASTVFAVFSLVSVLLSAEGIGCFRHSVTWGLIMMGGIESVWGVLQIYGFVFSNHSLYAMTGSFYNPGPYAGYLALVFPVCLHEWFRLKAINQRTWVEWIGYYFSLGMLLFLVCMLPASMSRSAWLAAVFSGVFVCWSHYSWINRWKRAWQINLKKTIVTFILFSAIVVAGGVGICQLKADSARGRLFIWKMSSLAIMEKPVSAYGTGNFIYAYGQAQEAYFAKGNYTKNEERVAGSPEYAFNEYLRIAVEYGIPVLFLVLAVIGICLYKGVKLQCIGICGGLVSLLVFSFSSYPMLYPGFLVTFLFLLVACCLNYSRRLIVLFAFVAGILGIWLVQCNTYGACQDWPQCKALYDIQEYGAAGEGYERLYPILKDRPRFLFEYGCCLHKLKKHDASIRILQEAERGSCDPMILNVIGKSHQALERYEEAEKWFIRSIHRLPGRIYPYYLLAKLYAEPDFRRLEKFREMGSIVLAKKPKVYSKAIEEMRNEIVEIARKYNLKLCEPV